MLQPAPGCVQFTREQQELWDTFSPPRKGNIFLGKYCLVNCHFVLKHCSKTGNILKNLDIPRFISAFWESECMYILCFCRKRLIFLSIRDFTLKQCRNLKLKACKINLGMQNLASLVSKPEIMLLNQEIKTVKYAPYYLAGIKASCHLRSSRYIVALNNNETIQLSIFLSSGCQQLE